ncbi:MAG: nitroreductase family protein [Gammaproteobacteria bacterium]|nr:nitroreductase family protein [Gammaproteobacteria bacterium]
MADCNKSIPLDFDILDDETMQRESLAFYQRMARRRSVRDFSDRKIPPQVLENAIMAAGTAPSGANMQPWHFVVVQDPAVKKRIRDAAEHEERALYEHRASDEWLSALAPLGTDANKPFLETAPALIAIFLKKSTIDEAGKKHKNYYTSESVGIASGLLITALHGAGLGTLTHTPSPMKFLSEILQRPSNERAFLLLVTGYPAEGTVVPDIKRRTLEQISNFI